MAGFEEGSPDQPRAGARVEDMRVRRQVGRTDQAIQRRGIGLHRGLLEPRGLAVKGFRKVPIMNIGRSSSHD